ncbi:MAG: hypothetical protein ABSE49_19945 [Polyangiaceae bacterium]
MVKDDAIVRTKRMWLFVLGLVCQVVAIPPLTLGVAWRLAAFSGAAVCYAGSLGLLVAWDRWWREERGRIRGDETGLWLDDRRVVRREGLAYAYLVREKNQWSVRLGRRWRPVDVVFETEPEGAALLDGMRLDPTRSVARFVLMFGTRRGAFVRAMTGLVAFALAGSAMTRWCLMAPHANPLLFLVLLGCVWVAWMLYSIDQFVRVSVGADGVRMWRLLSSTRFIPFPRVEVAHTLGTGIEIVLRSGGTIRLHPMQGPRPLLYRHLAPEGRKLVERVQAQLSAYRGMARAEATLFVRGHRSADIWLRGIDATREDVTSFRSPAIPADALWRLVDDAGAPVSARAGAAAALRLRLDDAGRARLRLLADACASQPLRAALEAVASGEDDVRLRSVLDGVEDTCSTGGLS